LVEAYQRKKCNRLPLPALSGGRSGRIESLYPIGRGDGRRLGTILPTNDSKLWSFRTDEIPPNSAGCAVCQDSNAVDSCGLIRRARPIEGVISSRAPHQFLVRVPPVPNLP